MLRREPDQIFNQFVNDVIEQYGDTKSADWLKLSQDLEELVNKEREYDINILSPRSCLIESWNSIKNYGLSMHIDKLENAFYCLSLYAINLCRQPVKKYYQHIKTYSGYYTCNIGSVMNGEDLPILLSMGYNINEKENEEELFLHHVNQNIKQLAFQLYLSQLYCRRIKMIVSAINGRGYSDEVAVRLLEHVHKPEFNLNEIFDYCELEKKKMEKGQDILKQKYTVHMSYEPQERMEWKQSKPPSMLHSFQSEDLQDDDLYGPSSQHLDSFGSSHNEMIPLTNIPRGPPDGVRMPPTYTREMDPHFYPPSYIKE